MTPAEQRQIAARNSTANFNEEVKRISEAYYKSRKEQARLRAIKSAKAKGRK